MKEAQTIIGHMMLVSSHCEMIKKLSNSSVKHVEYDSLVSDEAVEEIERHCAINSISITKIDELIDVHMDFCTIRITIKP